jgi:hypothetical protein
MQLSKSEKLEKAEFIWKAGKLGILISEFFLSFCELGKLKTLVKTSIDVS